MKGVIDHHFETIESAHDFVSLLSETVSQAKHELAMDVERASGADRTRRMDALRLALYKIDKLELHLNRSSRILNDLRSLRRLLFEERQERAETLPSRLASDSQTGRIESAKVESSAAA